MVSAPDTALPPLYIIEKNPRTLYRAKRLDCNKLFLFFYQVTFTVKLQYIDFGVFIIHHNLNGHFIN